ncbi:hypothetical protein GTN66_04640, partial [bacterium]|nr:hypothetical protein [bacterium]NIO18658.1 hypothetical protein [bacterium]NIO73689.1 hypothetical protein [bacterium]
VSIIIIIVVGREKNNIPIVRKTTVGSNEDANRRVVSLITKEMSIKRYVTIA